MRPAGLEGHVHWEGSVVVTDNQVKVRLVDEKGKELLQVNPWALAITLDGKTDDEVVASIYGELQRHIKTQQQMTVREYITGRAEFRKQDAVRRRCRLYRYGRRTRGPHHQRLWTDASDLLWCLAVLLSDAPAKRTSAS